MEDNVGEELALNKPTENHLKIKTSKKRNLFFGLATLILALLVIFFFFFMRIKAQRIDTAKLSAIMNNNNCASLNTVNSEKPNFNQLNASIQLLSFRAFCETQARQYAKSDATYNELNTYYIKQNNKGGISSVESFISDNKYASQHNGKMPYTSTPAQVSAEQSAASIMEKYEDSK
jgi:hypothetical protein